MRVVCNSWVIFFAFLLLLWVWVIKSLKMGLLDKLKEQRKYELPKKKTEIKSTEEGCITFKKLRACMVQFVVGDNKDMKNLPKAESQSGRTDRQTDFSTQA